jgi:hypothetical protein
MSTPAPRSRVAVVARNHETLVHDPRVLWPDTLSLAADGHPYFTANQLHCRAQFHEGKDLRHRKTCATYYDEHLPESSVEILGHSVGGITYRHYAHRAPLAFKAIMTIPQPTAFSALIHGHDGECPCCRRPFADAG